VNSATDKCITRIITEIHIKDITRSKVKCSGRQVTVLESIGLERSVFHEQLKKGENEAFTAHSTRQLTSMVAGILRAGRRCIPKGMVSKPLVTLKHRGIESHRLTGLSSESVNERKRGEVRQWCSLCLEGRPSGVKRQVLVNLRFRWG
jgi:hypothetical protein